MSDKVRNLTEATSLGTGSLFYAVDPNRAEGDTDVKIDKDNMSDIIGTPNNIDFNTLVSIPSIADTDPFIIGSASDSLTPKKGLWSLIKSTLKTYFDTIYTDKGGYNGTTQDLKDELDSVVFDRVVTYQTLSDFNAVTPVPNDGTPFKIANDGANNGNWSVVSGSPVKDADVVYSFEDNLLLQGANRLDGNTIGSWINNVLTAVYNATEDAIELPITGAGYQGIRLASVFQTDVDYVFDIELKLLSGEATPIRVGDFNEGGYVEFTPTSTFTKYKGKFNANTLQFGVFISAPNSVYNSNVLVRNFNVYINNTVQNDLYNEINILSGGAVSNFDLQAELNSKDNVLIPPGTHTINTTINIPSGKKIRGIRGKSILQASASVLNVLSIDGAQDVTLEDFTIKGTQADYALNGALNSVGSGVIADFNEAISENGVGTKSGIYLNDSEQINFKGLEISNFDAYGIDNRLSGKNYTGGVKITDCYIHNNYTGLKLSDEAEYSIYSNNSITRNQIAVRCESGNNTFTGNHIDKNRVGVVMTDGLNNSHGSFVGGTINHNSLFSVALNELEFGQIFNAVNIWYGDIYVKDSKGVSFSDCLLSNLSIFADGNFTGGGIWQIINSMFRTSVVINENHNSNTSNLSLKGNNYIDGSSNASVNN